MTLPATDAFTGSDGNPLSANWTVVGGTYDILTNAAHALNSTGNMAAWNADSFNANQYAQATAVAVSSGYIYCGVAVRVSLLAHTGYCYAISTNQSVYLDETVGGTYSDLALSAEYGSNNDVLRLEINGDSITAKRNGSVQFGGSKTDTTITSGYAGIHAYGSSTSSRIDDWEGGNLGTVNAWRYIDRKMPRGVLRGVA